MKALVVLAFILPLSLSFADGLPDQPYIYVVGQSRLEKSAEVALLRFDAVDNATDSTKAYQESQARVKKIFSVLAENKVEDRDIVAGDLQTSPIYEREFSGARERGKITGYSVSRGFKVQVRDLVRLPKLVETLITLGGQQFSAIEPLLSKPESQDNELRQRAIANAREQADKTAGNLGMKIDSVFAVSPVSIPEIQSNMLRQGEIAVTGSNIPTEQREDFPEYRLAPVVLQQTVHVIYLISPAK